jgi:hypothetical protein
MRLTATAILASALVAADVRAFSESHLNRSRRLGTRANRDELLDT